MLFGTARTVVAIVTCASALPPAMLMPSPPTVPSRGSPRSSRSRARPEARRASPLMASKRLLESSAQRLRRLPIHHVHRPAHATGSPDRPRAQRAGGVQRAVAHGAKGDASRSPPPLPAPPRRHDPLALTVLCSSLKVPLPETMIAELLAPSSALSGPHRLVVELTEPLVVMGAPVDGHLRSARSNQAQGTVHRQRERIVERVGSRRKEHGGGFCASGGDHRLEAAGVAASLPEPSPAACGAAYSTLCARTPAMISRSAAASLQTGLFRHGRTGGCPHPAALPPQVGTPRAALRHRGERRPRPRVAPRWRRAKGAVPHPWRSQRQRSPASLRLEHRTTQDCSQVQRAQRREGEGGHSYHRDTCAAFANRNATAPALAGRMRSLLRSRSQSLCFDPSTSTRLHRWHTPSRCAPQGIESNRHPR